MRTSLKTLFAAGAGLCLALGAATPAMAAPATQQNGSTAKLVGVVRLIDSTTAEVQAQYRCTGDISQLHLWVSVKQTADRTADPRLAAEGSSAISAGWSQSHRGVANLTCDGRTHVGKFIVDHVEYGFGTLAKGKAWVQFCLFDANNPEPPDPTAPNAAGPVSSMVFLNVR